MAALLRLSIFLMSWLCPEKAFAASKETINSVGSSGPCSDPIKIVVIGGGISGAATTTFLKQLTARSCGTRQPEGRAGDSVLLPCNCGLQIDLFEAADHLGGRLDHVNLLGGYVEMGGETVHSSNKYMRSFIEMYNSALEERRRQDEAVIDHSYAIPVSGERLVFNGHVVSEVRAVFLLLIRMVATSAVRAWEKIYALLEDGAQSLRECCAFPWRNQAAEAMKPKYATFDSGMALTKGVGLSSKLYTTFSSMLRWLVPPPGRAFVESIVYGIYTQASSLQSLAGLVSLAAVLEEARLDPEPYRSVVEHLIQTFADRVYLNCTIEKIFQHTNKTPGERHPRRFRLSSTNCESLAREGVSDLGYDYVVIAAPLSAALRIIRQADDGEAVEVSVPYYEYEEVFVTAVQARKIRDGAELVQPSSTVVATAEYSGSIGTFSVSKCTKQLPGPWSYPVTCKLKSGRYLSDADLAELFEGIVVVARREWKAYPLFYPFSNTPTFNSPSYPPAATQFELTPGLFHVSAFEGVFSCMEGQAVAARNVAQLLLNSVESESAEIRGQ